MTITSPLFVSNQGAFNVSCVNGRSALLFGTQVDYSDVSFF